MTRGSRAFIVLGLGMPEIAVFLEYRRSAGAEPGLPADKLDREETGRVLEKFWLSWRHRLRLQCKCSLRNEYTRLFLS